jgi:hypothetical protein
MLTDDPTPPCICACLEEDACEAEGCFPCNGIASRSDSLCEPCRQFYRAGRRLAHCHVFDFTNWRRETIVIVKGGLL